MSVEAPVDVPSAPLIYAPQNSPTNVNNYQKPQYYQTRERPQMTGGWGQWGRPMPRGSVGGTNSLDTHAETAHQIHGQMIMGGDRVREVNLFNADRPSQSIGGGGEQGY